VNERIQELALQAGNYAYKMNPEEDSYGRPANPRKFQQDRDEKFAELLIRECASQARQKAKIIKTKTETYSDDVGEMSVGLSVAWQFEVFAQEIEEYFRSEL
jgi:hypothetical protein